MTTATELYDATISAEGGDHELLAHYVEADEATRAYVEGVPVIALCGKVWIPSRDPSRYPVCPECREIYERLTQ